MDAISQCKEPEGENEMIRSMWKAGISEEQIASIAQKTVEEVRKLCK